MAQRDVVLRWIEQLAKVVARLIHGPGPIDLALAEDQVQDGLAQHLGPLASVVPRLDAESATGLLHDPERIFGYAQLLSLLAAVRHAGGDPAATDIHARAIAFARVALVRARERQPAWENWVAQAERWPAADRPHAESEGGQA